MTAATIKQDHANPILRAYKADPKKGILLSVLLIILIAVIGRMALSGGKSLPAAARAMLAGGDARPLLTPAAVQRQSAALQQLQQWGDAPVPPNIRNLFNVRIDYFPVDGSRTAQSATPEDGFWAKLEKSMSLQADAKDKRENLIANFKAQAGQLKLQSTMMGPQPRAMVNGELVGEGSVVADFRILKIEGRRIIVEREGIKLEIQMK